MRYVSNQGPDKTGLGAGVRFVASFERYEQAEALKRALDPNEPGRACIIFRSIVRHPQKQRASHETWHIDEGNKDSETVKEPDVDAIGFDLFSAPIALINDALQSWNRAELCDDITKLLVGFSQTGVPGGGA